MTEEQMNGLIEVLKEIRDELKINNVSQPNRKYMRRYLEVEEQIDSLELITNYLQESLDELYARALSDKSDEIRQNISKKQSQLKMKDKRHNRLLDELQRLEELLAEDIQHNNGYIKLEDNA